jgi:hypothetical protein
MLLYSRGEMATRAHTVPRFYLAGFVAPESESGHDPYIWIGSLETGQIVRKSPKNISIARGVYDGPGGFESADASIEVHLSRIESAGSRAIRDFVAAPAADVKMPSELLRFVAWQAARTPGWMELVQQWMDEFDPDAPIETVEAPPAGLLDAKARFRAKCMENPATNERLEIDDEEMFRQLKKSGWRWILSKDDHLEMLHIQAWYFQVRHFPRLSWSRLTAPPNQWFITSDRGVAWTADGCANVPPAALRHPTAQVVAPLTRTVTLLGRHAAAYVPVSPREVNQVVASMASA